MKTNQLTIILLATFSALHSNVDENTIQLSQKTQAETEQFIQDLELNHQNNGRFRKSQDGQTCHDRIQDFIQVLKKSPESLEDLRPLIESISDLCIKAERKFNEKSL